MKVLALYLDKMAEYLFGGMNTIEINKDEKEENKYHFYIWGKYLPVEAKNQKEIEEKIVDYFTEEKIKVQNQANKLEELALRIKENGLEKTSQYYRNQTLEHKNEGGN